MFPVLFFIKINQSCYQHSNAPKTNYSTNHFTPGKLPAADVQVMGAGVLPNLRGKDLFFFCEKKCFMCGCPVQGSSAQTHRGVQHQNQRICLNRELCPRCSALLASLPSVGHSPQTPFQKGAGARELRRLKTLV